MYVSMNVCTNECMNVGVGVLDKCVNVNGCVYECVCVSVLECVCVCATVLYISLTGRQQEAGLERFWGQLGLQWGPSD